MSVEQRRAAPRAKVNWRAQISIPDRGIVWARIKNISLAGLGLEVSYNLQKGQVMLLKIQAVIKGKTCEMLVRAKVRHTFFLADNKGVGAGCQFVEISSESKQLLNKMLKNGAVATS